MTPDETIRQCYQVPGQMWPTELGWLYDNISQSGSHAEIGTYCGRSFLASCAGMSPGSVVVSVDDASQWPYPEWVDVVQAATLNLLPGHLNVSSFRMHSIDNYAECRADIEAWQPLLNAGGLICGHDYWTQDVGVMDAVNEVFNGRHQVVPGTRIWTYKDS